MCGHCVFGGTKKATSDLGGAYVVRGLKVVNDRTWDSQKGVWTRFAATAKTIACSVRTAVEDVSDVDSITQYF